MLRVSFFFLHFGKKVFPDAIFFILVVSQWFLAGWSVVGAALYFRLFNGNRTCSRECSLFSKLVIHVSAQSAGPLFTDPLSATVHTLVHRLGWEEDSLT